MDLEILVQRYNEDTETKKVIPELEAYRLIWIKVILRAIYDYVLYKDSKNKTLKKEGENARKWLFEVPSIYKFNSLANLCLELDLSVESIRRYANSLTRAKVVKIEFLNRNKKR